MSLDHEAIRKAYPNVSLIDDTGSVIQDASGNTVAVEQSKIDEARVTLNNEAAATLYQKQRTGEAGTTDTIYASIGDQLDMQYKDAINGTTTWKDHITAVKAKYPKPS
tara:strand:- start:195 stop:518 length:324 start_codon:yes stop_codon:yes gene_type:complete